MGWWRAKVRLSPLNWEILKVVWITIFRRFKPKVSIFRRNFGGRRYERRGRNVDGRNFAKFRLKSARSCCRRKIGEIFKKSPAAAIYRRNFGLYRRFLFTDFSGNFLIFPTSPARAQDTKSVYFLKKKKKNIRCYLVIWSWFAGKGCVSQPGSKSWI